MRALVVLSGGMDSATALAHVVDLMDPSQVETITFNYGSKHNAKENECAKLLSAHYGVQNTLVELPFVGTLFASDLLKSGGDIPEGHYAEENMKRTVVPFRNGIMLSVAAGFAESRGRQEVILGNHAGDHAVYPDCRRDFTEAMTAAIELGTWKGIHLRSPFVGWSKSQIVSMGLRLGVPYQLTWSCYKGGATACGKCGTCVERLEAFKLAGVIDPLEYVDREYFKTVCR